MNRYIYIDPSINNTGYAIKENNKIILSGVIKTNGNSDSDKLFSLYTQIKNIILKNKIKKMIIEDPEHFIYNRHVNNWTRKPFVIKNINKLHKSIAVLELLAKQFNLEIEYIKVREWKKNYNKKIIMKITGKTNHNEADAVGMAMFSNIS